MAVTLRVQCITSYAELLGLREDWQALERSAGMDLPFQTWEWSTSWWKHLHEDRRGVRDTLRVYVVRDSSGEIVGIAPLMLTERPRFGPIRIRFLQFIGADPNITELHSMLCNPGLEHQCHAAIRAHLGSQAREWDWIAWEGPSSQTGSVAGMTDPLGNTQEKSAFVLTLAPTWAELKKRLRRNVKESIRKCYNSLKRDGLTYRLETLEEPADIELALPDFFRLHTARASLKGVTNHFDAFDSPEARAFLIDVCRRLAERRITRVFRLWVDGKLVATRIGFEMAGTLYMYYSGWAPAYSQYSVMTTLVCEVIQQAIERGLNGVHLSTGNERSKTRWGTNEVCYASGVQFSPRRSARATHLLYEAVMQLRSNNTARAVIPGFLVRRSKAWVTSHSGSRDQQLPNSYNLAIARRRCSCSSCSTESWTRRFG